MAKPTRSMTGADGPRDGSRWTDRPAEEIVEGTILGEKYRLISQIGRGGMGSVWRAEHLGWDAPVALKLMNQDITAHPEAIARFEREVRLAAGLRSPHVVQVLDHGVDLETGTPFIAMELLEGESLARRLKRACLSPAETFDVFSQLVRALSRAHAAGIVHRDLKPDNVFLVKNEEESLVKVLDFGVAKWTAPDILESGLTRPGSVVGTPFYMSPEQIQGSREIDHRADLWALAAIACECLTGRRPFEAPDFAQLAVLLLGNAGRPLPSSLGPVPPSFDAWFLRATDPDISRRFQSAREMVQTLAPVCDVSPASDVSYSRPLTSTRQEVPSMAPVSNTSSRPPFAPSLWQQPMTKLVASTVVTTLLVTGGLAYLLLGREPPAPSHGAAPPVAVSPAPPSVPKPTGPGIRPIRNGEPEVLDGQAEPGIPPSPPADDVAPPATNGTDVGNLETEEARKVRAARLDKRRKYLQPKPSHGSKRPTPSSKAPPVATAPATDPEPSSSEGPSEPPPAATQPAATDPASKVVDGRRIRTSL